LRPGLRRPGTDIPEDKKEKEWDVLFPRGEDLLERSTNSSLLGIAFRARDRSGALMHMLNPNSGVQGCPESVLGFLIQNSASATRDYCVLRSQDRSYRAEHLDHEIFLKDTAYLAPAFQDGRFMRRERRCVPKNGTRRVISVIVVPRSSANHPAFDGRRWDSAA
jgi:hypothetical protein